MKKGWRSHLCSGSAPLLPCATDLELFYWEMLVVLSIDSADWEEMILRKFGKLNVIALDYLKNQADVCYPSQSIVHVNVWKHLPNSSGRCWLFLYCLSHCSRMNWVEACYDGTCFKSSVGRNNGCVWLWDMGLLYLVFELLPKNSLLLLSWTFQPWEVDLVWWGLRWMPWSFLPVGRESKKFSCDT